MNQIRLFLDAITFSDVATWVLIVLAAGFIGQFGRKFSEYLIERAKRKKGSSDRGKGLDETGGIHKAVEVASPASGDSPVKQAEILVLPKEAKERSKNEKKNAKALVKRMKKTTPSE